ncbi:unnamed protein product [Nezara viridula]|uniref:Uncharacterized protein n=1 Tax=Nezara viridula TaxID=85310 RepID=A0A9P0H4U7_NEZVI|nr:unnamed protein product [Nezara viridula]
MILCLLEVIGFSSRILIHLARPGQLSSGCKRTFQRSFLPWIAPEGSPDLNPLDCRLWSELRRWDATEQTLTCKASNNLLSELSVFLKKCCVMQSKIGHGDYIFI